MRRWTGLLLCVVLSGAMVRSPATAQTDAVKALEKLFDTDAAQAFVQAARMLEGPAAEGDLEGMLEIIRVVERASRRCWYYAPVEDMIDAALPAARDSGKWEALGELYATRAGLMWDKKGDGGAGGMSLAMRSVHFVTLAQQAYAKAGKTPEPFLKLKQSVEDYIPKLKQQQAKTAQSRAGRLGPKYHPLIEGLDQAVAEGRDAEALSLMEQVLGQVPADLERGEGEWRYTLAAVTKRLWIRGAERLVPALRRLAHTEAESPGGSADIIAWMHTRCALAWSGRRDIFYDTLYWAFNQLYVRPDTARGGGSPYAFVHKLHRLGRFAEADRVTGAWAQWLLNSGRGDASAASCVHERTPPDLRRALLFLTLRNRLETQRRLVSSDAYLWRGVVEKAPRGQERVWAYETARQLLEAALAFPDAESRTYGIAEAAKLFESAGRPDLAAETRGLSPGLRRQTPDAVQKWALETAESAASRRRWQDVGRALRPIVMSQLAPEPLLQAYVLLAQASQGLGRRREAETWVDRAAGLAGEAPLPAAKRVNYLMSIAALTGIQARKVWLLQQAQGACEEAGLAPMAEKIGDQLVQAALKDGALPAAERMLVGIIDRNERKRERLAFDPVLRQQWFADNITPYRQLLRVAALKRDPYLALSCAERMRARVLMDQLSWRKVDMAVRLPPPIRQRLERLRKMRKRAYALLDAVVGGVGAGSGDDGRGMYMPIRGMYMPIRGPLQQRRPSTETDAKRLKQLLESLARDEAALESVIRECIPAYATASSARIPSGRQFAQVIAKRPELAVLEYTFSDEGLVVVALRGGKSPKVALISQQQREALWEYIGRFRQQIWERKEELRRGARGLYQLLVAPVEQMVAGADRVWVVAEGALQLVPFAALIDADGSYLGQRAAVAYAPSLYVALSSRGRRRPAQRTAVILAAPDTGAVGVGGDARGAYMPIRGMYMPVRGTYMPIRGEAGVSSVLTAMAMVPLPGARAEGEALAQQFEGSLLLSGKDATKARLLAEGGKCDVLHLATHGYADPDVPEFSVLLLAGRDEQQPYEVLTALEVYSWPLRARLVTLSACQTALGKDVEGEGVLGLTRAFIHAGAQNVLCSLWPVSDESTRRLMTAFYESLQNGATVEQALREAQSLLLDAEDTRHPFYWAGFVAVRGPG